MKYAIAFLTLALVFLAVSDQSRAEPNRKPGEYESKGKQTKSASDIESSSSEEKQGFVKVGDLSYETGSKKNEYSQDIDKAEASEKEETVDDGCGHSKKVKSRSKKSSSIDVDGSSSSTYSKVKY